MLSILIVNWNTRELLRACLASLRNHPPQAPFEVIVVDNDSRDASADMVEREFPEVRLIRSAVNTGYARGNNLAFAAAKGDHLLTLNPDTEFLDDSLTRASGWLSAHPDYGCVAVRLVSPDGSTQHSVRGFPTVVGLAGDVTGLGAKRPASDWDTYRLAGFDYDLEQDAPQPMGTFLLFRREALAAIGDPSAPFDEGFPIFFNEVDLLYRLHLKGWNCRYLPDLKVLHHGGESTRQVRPAMIWESHRSLVRYLKKHHGNGVAKLGLPILSSLIYAAAFARARGYHAGFRA